MSLEWPVGGWREKRTLQAQESEYNINVFDLVRERNQALKLNVISWRVINFFFLLGTHGTAWPCRPTRCKRTIGEEDTAMLLLGL